MTNLPTTRVKEGIVAYIVHDGKVTSLDQLITNVGKGLESFLTNVGKGGKILTQAYFYNGCEATKEIIRHWPQEGNASQENHGLQITYSLPWNPGEKIRTYTKLLTSITLLGGTALVFFNATPIAWKCLTDLGFILKYEGIYQVQNEVSFSHAYLTASQIGHAASNTLLNIPNNTYNWFIDKYIDAETFIKHFNYLDQNHKKWESCLERAQGFVKGKPSIPSPSTTQFIKQLTTMCYIR
jgi:hypothetical protein